MIMSLSEMRRALKRKYSGVILYEGPSMLDGAPIAVIACRIDVASTNEKTGAMVQTFVIRTDIAPHKALKTGDDVSVCGMCPQRPALGGKCYVKVFQAPYVVYSAFHRGCYARPGIDFDAALIPDIFAGLAIRLGTYGDPAAAPFQIWRAATLKARKLTGYSHQWRDSRFAAFRLLCMASADNENDMRDASAMGWRTFRVKAIGAPNLTSEITCPASEEAGKRTTCAACGLCNGESNKARNPVNIAIELHGPRAPRRKKLVA